MKSSIAIGNEEMNESSNDEKEQESSEMEISTDNKIKKQNNELDLSIKLLNLQKEIENLKKENITQKALLFQIKKQTYERIASQNISQNLIKQNQENKEYNIANNKNEETPKADNLLYSAKNIIGAASSKDMTPDKLISLKSDLKNLINKIDQEYPKNDITKSTKTNRLEKTTSKINHIPIKRPSKKYKSKSPKSI